ncbi:hypothetical protein LX36DRAFT_474499 [Colletotrichum falcatum]|nr:hypothetical protein LX36DRAFT_474499 [Colletotrichum falcatum]
MVHRTTVVLSSHFLSICQLASPEIQKDSSFCLRTQRSPCHLSSSFINPSLVKSSLLSWTASFLLLLKTLSSTSVDNPPDHLSSPSTESCSTIHQALLYVPPPPPLPTCVLPISHTT